MKRAWPPKNIISEDVWRRLVDEYVAAVVFDAGGQVVAANAQFEELSQFKDMAQRAPHWTELMAPRGPGGDVEAIRRELAAHQVWRGEIECTRADGASYWSRATLVPAEGQGGPYWLALLSDISAYKETERSLVESEGRFRLFADNVDEGIVVYKDGLIVDVSDVWARMFGYEHENAIGLSPLDFTAPELHEHVRALMAQDFDEPYESVLLRSDGTRFPALVRGRVLPFKGRSVRLATVLDISQQKAQEEALRLAKAAAERATQAKSDFLSSMSHELKTPLNAVLGFAQVLELGHLGKLSAEQQNCVDHIKKGGAYLVELIDDILELARLDSGKLDISITRVSPAEVIRECIELTRPLANEQGLVLTVELEGEPPVMADRTRLKQVLLNLLSNAIKYNRAQGRVQVKLRRTATGVRIGVQDTGVGIAEARRGQLFQPFNRLGAEATETEGTGIGLVVAKKLMEMMRGRIGVHSEVSVGSTFWVELPHGDEERGEAFVVPASEAQTPEPPRLAEAVATALPARLLYIEDNPRNLALMEMVVAGVPGLSMISAPTGRLGIELARTHDVDVIIVDINLPDMSGFGVLRSLQQNPATAHIPTLALTASTSSTDRSRGLAAGFHSYLGKPMRVSEVMDALRRAVAGR